MKNYMIIKQKVSNLAKFQKTFDGLQSERSKAGEFWLRWAFWPPMRIG
jgi:hypothetical protein